VSHGSSPRTAVRVSSAADGCCPKCRRPSFLWYWAKGLWENIFSTVSWGLFAGNLLYRQSIRHPCRDFCDPDAS